MAYEKTTWVDGETPISAENLNKMEEGIVEASQTGGILEGTIVDYDGETVPEGYEEVENKNMIMTEVKSQYNVTASTNYQQDTIKSTLSVKRGTKITLQEDGGFRIGKGINLIKVSTCMNIQTASTNKLLGLSFFKNTARLVTCYKIKYGTSYDFYDMSNYLIEVVEGDVIYPKTYIDVSGDSITIKPGTYITIEEV